MKLLKDFLIFSVIIGVVAGLGIYQVKIQSAETKVVPTLQVFKTPSLTPSIVEKQRQAILKIQNTPTPTPTQAPIVQRHIIQVVYPTLPPYTYPTTTPFVWATPGPIEIDCTVDGQIIGHMTLELCQQKTNDYYASKIVPTPAGSQYSQNSAQIDCYNKYRAVGAIDSSDAMRVCGSLH